MSDQDVMRAVAIARGRDVEDEEMFFATAKGICERNAELEAEKDGYLGELSRMRLEVELLRSENAELRELVRDMQHAIACLVVLGDDYAAGHEDELCALDDRMRELGVMRNDSY